MTEVEHDIKGITRQLDNISPKILQITHSSPLTSKGGIEVYVYDITNALAAALPNAKIQCMYPLYKDEPETRTKFDNIEYVPIPLGKVPSKSLFAKLHPVTNSSYFFRTILPIVNADIIHIQYPFQVKSLLNTAFAYLCQKKVVITTHAGENFVSSLSKRNKLLYDLLLRSYRFFNPLFSVLSKDGAKVTKAPSVCISSYLPSEFDRELKQNYNKDMYDSLAKYIGNRTPLLQIGSICSRKNPITTLKTLERLSDMSLCAIFVYGYSEKKYLNDFFDYITHKKLDEKTLLLEKVAHENLPTIYKAVCDKKGIGILPSNHEGLPLVMLESMGFALPFITTNRDGMKDVIQNKYNGILVDNPFDDERFSYEIRKLFENKGYYDKISNNSYIRSKDFSIEEHVNKLILLYSSLFNFGVPVSKKGLPHYKSIITIEDHLYPEVQ